MDALLARLMDAQDAWVKPLGAFVQRIVKALFGPIRPIKDFLNGTWLGHSVHVALTDLPVGAFTLVIIFDILGLAEASLITLVFAIVVMLATAVATVVTTPKTSARSAASASPRTSKTIRSVNAPIGRSVSATCTECHSQVPFRKSLSGRIGPKIAFTIRCTKSPSGRAQRFCASIKRVRIKSISGHLLRCAERRRARVPAQ